MKLAQFRQILEAAEDLYHQQGNVAAAQSLRRLSSLFEGDEKTTVSSFLKNLAAAGDAEVGPR
jgi:hypothetical protein